LKHKNPILVIGFLWAIVGGYGFTKRAAVGASLLAIRFSFDKIIA
jgi:hypothetical protein